MNPLRVALIADLLEEQWPSMDLVADMLVEHLAHEHAPVVGATLVRPPMSRRARRIPVVGARYPAFMADRFSARLWDYPRYVRGIAQAYDVFHIVDHSYAHLVHDLPAKRVLVTCHDMDTFRSVLEPVSERRSWPFRLMTRRILSGLVKAGHVACDTAATRDALVAHASVDPSKASVVHNGPHPACSPEPEPAADVEAARLLGPAAGRADLLHVGSTIPRKRIDILLWVFAGVKKRFAEARLVRVGGALTGEQRRLARELNVEGSVVTLPFLDRTTLASVYRRSALVLLTSEREGFGLPVLEALACGTPVVASDIAALREVGGTVIDYCPSEDVERWVGTVCRRLEERRRDPAAAASRQKAALERARAFSWTKYTRDVVALYHQLSGRQAVVA